MLRLIKKQIIILLTKKDDIEVKDSEEHRTYFFQIEKIDKINDIKTETEVVKDKVNEYKKTVLKNR